MAKPVLKVDHVSMKFNLSTEKVDNLKEYFIKSLKGQISYNEYWALKDVSFKLQQGDRLGILGTNGAGKSTLLKVIAGVLKPTEGSIVTRGKIVPLLELGAPRIFIYMALCWDIQRSLLMKSMTRLWNFQN